MDYYVAKSYQDLPKLGEPFVVDGKKYINVQMKSGKSKTVRTYNEKEYAKLYGSMQPLPADFDTYYKPQKEVLGFVKDYITIFKGVDNSNEDWFKTSPCRYCVHWGWYLPSDMKLTNELPFGVESVRLDWERVGAPSGKLFSPEAVRKAVDVILYPSSTGSFVGEIGQRIEVTLTVERSIPIEGNYGHSTIHIFSSPEGNTFVWTTAAKSWGVGSVHRVKGTIKAQNIYKGVNQNVLKNVREVA